MTIGTCNVNQTYNGTLVDKKQAFKMFDYFYENGGRKIDAAYNYASHGIIKEWLQQTGVKDVKIITKIWKQDEFFKCFDELGLDKIYCIMCRENNQDIVEFLRDQRENGKIEKFGISCYLPEEMGRSYFNCIQIPCDKSWFDRINIMSVYAEIYIRSYYNHWIRNGYDDEKINRIRLYKVIENPKVEFVVGCDDIEQLKINMELFK